MVRWSEISSNPDSPEVLSDRRNKVSASQTAPVECVANFINTVIRNEHVIDVGYANHHVDTSSISAMTTHSIVRENALHVIGVDLVDIDANNDEKCTYHTGNIFDNDFARKVLDDKFIDTIFAGNLLEHLDCPGLLFKLFSAMKEQNKTKKLVILVPNPLWLIGIFDILRPSISDLSQNVDHVGMFYPGAMVELAERNNVRLKEWCYVGRKDMVTLFAPRPRTTQLLWAGMYWYSRWRRLPFAYNQIGYIFE
jgi:hypothetical protein